MQTLSLKPSRLCARALLEGELGVEVLWEGDRQLPGKREEFADGAVPPTCTPDDESGSGKRAALSA